MSVVRMPAVCDRARAQVSRRLDGELSQLEELMLSAHLERCADCCAFASDVEGFTAEIRSAPLERLELDIEIRRLRRLPVPGVRIGVAAALAVAVVGSLLQVASQSGNVSGQSPTVFGTSRPTVGHVEQIVPDGRAVPLRGSHGGLFHI
jgi:predicted anti-sigma-YlaC factor YlaD